MAARERQAVDMGGRIGSSAPAAPQGDPSVGNGPAQPMGRSGRIRGKPALPPRPTGRRA